MITVNPSSQISAQEFVNKIRRSDAPAHIKNHIRAVGRGIVGPKAFVQPPQTIEPIWLTSFADVFNSDLWEISTARVQFEVTRSGVTHTVRKNIFMDLGKGERGPLMCVKTGPDPADRECSVSRHSLFQSFALGDGKAELDYGQTFSTEKMGASLHVELKSARALVILVNRVQMFGSTDSTPSRRIGFRQTFIPDGQIVKAFLHELVAHAAPTQAGKPSSHGEGSVNRHAEEAEALVTATSPLEAIFKALAATAKELDAAATGARRARQPGPIRQ